MSASQCVQITVAYLEGRWVVMRNAEGVGEHHDYEQALGHGRRLAAEASAAGLDCSLLVRDEAGHWRDEPCGPQGDIAA